MKNKRLRSYYLWSVIGVLIASFYPLYMGARVIVDMIRDGEVLAQNYPKYIIPYTPVSLAVIVGTLLLPLFLRYAKRFALLSASGVSLIVFFVSELLLESQVIVAGTKLESWQMYMCYISPDMYETRPWTAIDVRIGGYSPAFKLHFYAISIVLILSLLNCIYGFGRMIDSGDRSRKKPLILQSVSTGLILGLCIWACFTAFYRTGELQVSPVSAVLMGLFFVLFGLTMGLYAGSFLYRKSIWLSVMLPAAVSSLVTLGMYIGEMCLLSGYLYRFGTGFFFEPLGAVALAPVDVLIVLLAGVLCGCILRAAKTDA